VVEVARPLETNSAQALRILHSPEVSSQDAIVECNSMRAHQRYQATEVPDGTRPGRRGGKRSKPSGHGPIRVSLGIIGPGEITDRMPKPPASDVTGTVC
jgi:hypothetical protein